MKSGAVIFISVFGLLWSSVTLVFDSVMAREITAEWRSREFAQTTGHVKSSKVTSYYGGRSISYIADIVYDYTVNGRTFSGSKLRYGVMFNSSRDQAQSAVDRHPAGRETPVFFDPANPADAVLEAGLSGVGLFTTVFITPFNVIMVGLWSAVADALRNSKSNRVAGGVRLLGRGLVTRARLPRFTAFAILMLTLAGTSFVSIFIVGFSTKMNPSLNNVIATWCAVLGLSVFAFARRWLRIQSGADDLVLDEGSLALTLPRTFGRKQAMLVPFSEVKTFAVESIEQRSNKGGVSYTYAPTVHFKDGRKEEKLADWADREKADAFTAWLREKTGAHSKQ